MLIRKDGSWIHEGKPIRRPSMVRLFASILKREGEEYYLVNPVEKVRIQVEDCPFVIVAMECTGISEQSVLRFTTNVGEIVELNSDHRLNLGKQGDEQEPHPVIYLRDELSALLNRNVFYELSQYVVEYQDALGIWSAGEFHSLQPL